MADNAKLQNINQEFKEKDIQERAKDLGLSYINLLSYALNPDCLSLIKPEESEAASMVVFLKVGRKLRLAMADPENKHAKKVVERLKSEGYAVNINLASEESIKRIQSFYRSDLYTVESESNIEINDDDKDIQINLESLENISTKNADDILKDIHSIAIKLQSSDIHFQPAAADVKLRMRVDGLMQAVNSFDHKVYQDLLRSIKMKSKMKLNITTSPQDGQYLFTVNNSDIDVRVSVLPSVYGESAVLRVLDSARAIQSLSDLGYQKFSLKRMANILSRPEGLIIICGPTGSGKTTSMYSLLSVLNKPQKKIITLEDPVEYKLEGLTQCEVNKEGFSFLGALRSVLRQDPDVIMLGEVRDSEVAVAAMQAAMTGHQVLTTLHANNSIDALTRFKNLGIKNNLLSSSLNAIIAQRLIRKVCPHCQEEKKYDAETLKTLKRYADSFRSRSIELPELKDTYLEGKGCKECKNTGYLARTTISEILILTDAVRELLLTSSPSSIIAQKAVEEGFIPMREDAMLKVIDRTTNYKEVLRVLG